LQGRLTVDQQHQIHVDMTLNEAGDAHGEIYDPLGQIVI